MRIQRVFAQDRVFLTALFLLLTVIVGSLFYMTRRWQQAMESIPPAILARVDARTLAADLPAGLIGRFRELEQSLRQEFPDIQSLAISLVRDGQARLVYPPFLDRAPSRAQTYPLDAGGGVVAQVHLTLDTGRLDLLRATAWGSSLVSLLVYIGILLRTLRQERRIAETRSELAQKQEEIIRLERLALVGQLSAAILHDLKKPVLNIRDEAATLGRDDPLAAGILEQADLFFQILRETDIESLVRRDTGREEYLDPVDIVQRSVNLVRYQSDGAAFHMALDESLPLLFGTRHRLIQVFSNLLLNALQATGGKGEIRVSGSVSTAGGADWLDIAIADNGPGIDDAIRDRIFEPLFSGGSGSGLGLYIVETIVTGMGGRIGVRSQPGRGTTFVVSFPVRDESSDA